MPESMASMFKRLWILTIHSFFCHSFRVPPLEHSQQQ